MMHLMANGTIPSYTDFWSHPAYSILHLIYVPNWHEIHFYLGHRLLHIPFLYKYVHSLHHKARNPGPFSGLSMHPVEHFIYFSSFVTAFVYTLHPLHLLFQQTYSRYDHMYAISYSIMRFFCSLFVRLTTSRLLTLLPVRAVSNLVCHFAFVFRTLFLSVESEIIMHEKRKVKAVNAPVSDFVVFMCSCNWCPSISTRSLDVPTFRDSPELIIGSGLSQATMDSCVPPATHSSTAMLFVVFMASVCWCMGIHPKLGRR